MKKIAVYGQYLQEDSIDTFVKVLDQLDERGCQVFVLSSYLELLPEKVVTNKVGSFSQLDETFDLLISIGGDGTLLRAVSYIEDLNIPVMGINTGRLGFLSTLQPEQIQEAFLAYFNGDFILSKRQLITASVNGDLLEDDHRFALNEITVSRMNTTSMIQIDTYLDDAFLTTYWSDGLIISTPTGSTGYSLSCGGPLVSPQTNALVITPIAPHNLNARPLVIPDDTKIKVVVKSREDAFLLSLDNRVHSYPNNTEVTIEKTNFTIDLVQLEGGDFLKTIRQKLLWGEDKRN